MKNEDLIRKGPNVPTEERALARLRRAVSWGSWKRYRSFPGFRADRATWSPT